MRKLLVVAALVLISSAADAKVHNLNFGGRSVRVEVPAGCKRVSCMNVIEKARSSRRGRKAAEPETAAAAAPAAAVTTAAVTAADTAPKAEIKTEPKVEAVPPMDERRPVSRLTLPNTETAKPATTQVVSVQTGSSQNRTVESKSESAPSAAATPLGLWHTEKREGKIRIVECGQALCGHVDGAPTKKVLLDMQPAQKNRWNGKVNDVRRGGTYAAHITLRNANSLRVEGCAMGGMFCGGETWTRVE